MRCNGRTVINPSELRVGAGGCVCGRGTYMRAKIGAA